MMLSLLVGENHCHRYCQKDRDTYRYQTDRRHFREDCNRATVSSKQRQSILHHCIGCEQHLDFRMCEEWETWRRRCDSAETRFPIPNIDFLEGTP